MRVATAWSELSDPMLALEQAYQALMERLGAQAPDWVLVSSTIAYDAHALYAASQAHQLPLHRVHGLSSSRGVMTEQGHHGGGEQRRALALWGVVDEDGDFGVGAASLGDAATPTPHEAARAALDQALARAGRPGQVPQAVWVSTIPGIEEQVLKGIESYLGDQVLIMGGSAADDEVSGRWQLWSSAGVQDHDVILSVLFPSGEVFVGFQSGYEPTEHHGVVTRSSGRHLIEIDGEPAAHVYHRWSQGALIADEVEGGNIMAQTSMHPLGRPVNQLHGITYYQLSHPAYVSPEGGLELFTEVEVGEQVFMMRGTRDSLVERAGRISSSLLQIHQLEQDRVQGALVIYCAGCMMAIEARMPSVVDGLTQALPGVPLLGAYTFGEQGCFLGGENRHANMMIAVMLWLDERF